MGMIDWKLVDSIRDNLKLSEQFNWAIIEMIARTDYVRDNLVELVLSDSLDQRMLAEVYIKYMD